MASSKSNNTHALLFLLAVALLVAAVDVDAQPLAPDPLVSNDDLLEWYKELVQDRDLVVQQLRAYESRISVQKEYLKKMDVQLKEMVETSAEKKMDQAVWKLASAPWLLATVFTSASS